MENVELPSTSAQLDLNHVGISVVKVDPTALSLTYKEKSTFRVFIAGKNCKVRQLAMNILPKGVCKLNKVTDTLNSAEIKQYEIIWDSQPEKGGQSVYLYIHEDILEMSASEKAAHAKLRQHAPNSKRRLRWSTTVEISLRDVPDRRTAAPTASTINNLTTSRLSSRTSSISIDYDTDSGSLLNTTPVLLQPDRRTAAPTASYINSQPPPNRERGSSSSGDTNGPNRATHDNPTSDGQPPPNRERGSSSSGDTNGPNRATHDNPTSDGQPPPNRERGSSSSGDTNGPNRATHDNPTSDETLNQPRLMTAPSKKATSSKLLMLPYNFNADEVDSDDYESISSGVYEGPLNTSAGPVSPDSFFAAFSAPRGPTLSPTPHVRRYSQELQFGVNFDPPGCSTNSAGTTSKQPPNKRTTAQESDSNTSTGSNSYFVTNKRQHIRLTGVVGMDTIKAMQSELQVVTWFYDVVTDEINSAMARLLTNYRCVEHAVVEPTTNSIRLVLVLFIEREDGWRRAVYKTFISMVINSRRTNRLKSFESFVTVRDV